MSNNIYRLDFFKEIFDIDQKNKYTESALLYQNILRSFLRDITKYYTSWDINSWLQSNHPFKSGRTSNKENKSLYQKITNRQQRVMHYLRELSKWKLLEINELMNEKRTLTNYYFLTSFGHIILLIIEATRSNVRQKIYEELYELLEVYFKNKPSSLDSFCLKYFKKCKDEKLFDLYFDYFTKTLLYWFDIASEKELYTLMILQKFPEHQFESFMILWKKSFLELSQSNQDLLMYHIKFFFEGMMQLKAKYLANYEEFRYDFRGKRDLINVEIECNKCKEPRYVTIPFMTFMNMYFENIREFSQIQSHKIRCNKCNCNIFEFPFKDFN